MFEAAAGMDLNNASLSDFERLTVLLAEKLNFISRHLPASCEEELMDIAGIFWRLPPPFSKRSKKSLFDSETSLNEQLTSEMSRIEKYAPLFELRRSKYIIDLLKRKLISDCKPYIEGLVAACGRSQAAKELRELAKYCKEVEKELTINAKETIQSHKTLALARTK